MPKTVGGSGRVPSKPPVSAELPSTISLISTEKPNVSTARLTPRVRNAGNATSAPTGIAASAPAMTAGRNGQPNVVASRPAAHAPNPARAICARDSCPTNPVTTTSERHTIAVAKLIVSGNVQSFGASSRNVAAPATATPAPITYTRPLPTAGSRSSNALRNGRDRPPTTITTTMRRNANDRYTEADVNLPSRSPSSATNGPNTPLFSM